ncbi:MAG: hypothetical protein K0S34_1287 [Bacillales bacterium]|jgi:hypothetical protein|nr:hypothetical protein [Bacillales bacterium]
MNKNDYKRVINKFEPDPNFKNRLVTTINSTPKSFNFKPVLFAAASVLVIITGVIIGPKFINNDTPKKQQAITFDSVEIPKIELPEGTEGSDSPGAGASGMSKMMPIIVYKSNIYTLSDIRIDPKSVKDVIGEKIGTTKDNLNEWSSQNDYATELASTVGVLDVYKVKGFNSDFRIITVEDVNGETSARYYENFNGISVSSGKDVFDKLKLEENVTSAAWQSLESWSNGLQEKKEIELNPTITDFLQVLYNSEPIPVDKIMIEGPPETQKFLFLTMKDNSTLILNLYKDGYVNYGTVPIFFKPEKKAFESFWNTLE